MNKILKAVLVVGAFAPVATGTAFAQVGEEGMGKVLPVEIYACTFNNRQDAGDLDEVNAQWNRWMDERNLNNYAAWVLTPFYYTPEQAFDVLWLGAWTDGNAMGSGADQWLRESGDIGDAFEDVLTCGAHIGLASAMYKAAADNQTPASGVITMMDCKLNEGNRYEDIKAAEMEWAEHMTSAGSTAATFHWFPTFGGGEADYDYKVVNAYSSFSELGADWERYSNGGGREASTGIFGDIDDCDDARVYNAKVVRAAQLR